MGGAHDLDTDEMSSRCTTSTWVFSGVRRSSGASNGLLASIDTLIGVLMGASCLIITLSTAVAGCNGGIHGWHSFTVDFWGGPVLARVGIDDLPVVPFRVSV